MNNSEKIIRYLTDNQATVTEIAGYLAISRQAVHRILNKLALTGKVSKAGEPPRVYYTVRKQLVRTATIKGTALIINGKTKAIVEDNFLYITPFGYKLAGWEGFAEWCTERKQDITKMSQRYVETLEKYNRFRKNGLIDGMSKLKHTFAEVALDEVLYVDFYNIEIFGKTKLGQLLLFAKQSQDRGLMNQLIDDIRPAILMAIKTYKIDGVGFIPPTVKREHQLMRQLQSRLNLDIRIVRLDKLKTPVIVPQKTLNKLEDRIINARETIAVNETGQYTNILLLDDAVGSGATLNEVAKKIKQKRMCSGKIIGLAITGSANGFEVISEV